MVAENERQGYRGYVASRPVRGQLWPQHIQNLLLRDYAGRHGLTYRLSVTEYAMPSCYMGLQTVLDELPRLQGALAFSLFMLPKHPDRRRRVQRRFQETGTRLHAVLEDLMLYTDADWRDADDMLSLETVVTASPIEEIRRDLC